MKTVGPISRAIAIGTLLCFAAPQAEALEVYGTGAGATQMDDGLLLQVRGGRGGGGARGGGGGMHRGAAEACTEVAAACIAAAATRTGGVCTAGCTGPAEPTPDEGTFIEETSTGT